MKPTKFNNQVDTLDIYELKFSCFYEKKINSYTNLMEYDYTHISYLKFYKNGKLGLFIIPIEKTKDFNRDFFNPEKAKMGYYELDENFIKKRISTIGDCSLYISNQEGIVKGDTIFFHNLNNNHGNVYIKKNVDVNFLKNWLPDW